MFSIIINMWFISINMIAADLWNGTWRSSAAWAGGGKSDGDGAAFKLWVIQFSVWSELAIIKAGNKDMMDENVSH